MKPDINYQKLKKYLSDNNIREYLVNYEVPTRREPLENVHLNCKNLSDAKRLLRVRHAGEDVNIITFLPIDYKPLELSLFKIEYFDREWEQTTTHEIVANSYIGACEKLFKEVIMPRDKFEIDYDPKYQEIEINGPSFFRINRFIHEGTLDPKADLLKFLHD